MIKPKYYNMLKNNLEKVPDYELSLIYSLMKLEMDKRKPLDFSINEPCHIGDGSNTKQEEPK